MKSMQVIGYGYGNNLNLCDLELGDSEEELISSFGDPNTIIYVERLDGQSYDYIDILKVLVKNNRIFSILLSKSN